MSLAFRLKVRVSTEEGASETNPESYIAKVQLARDVADVLRKNVVQGVRQDNDTWRESPSRFFFPKGFLS